MRKIIMTTLLLMFAFTYASAQKQAEIKFDKKTHNFGTFTNVGDAPLVINQAVPSCGCTAPQYPKNPIAPGDKGTIEVVYDGRGKIPGHFKKTITVRTNGATEMTRLYVEGDMTEE